MKYSTIAVMILFWATYGMAQNSINPVSWKMELKDVSVDGASHAVHITAEVKENWQLYSNDFDPELGPMVTEFMYTKSADYHLVGGTIPQGSHRKYDDLWGGEYAYFEHNAFFIQQIKASGTSPVVECQIEYQVCNTLDGKCIPFQITLKNQ